ncbi:hypothetical protein [Halovivax sp.]|uniref:hypothetical protein n=1 Tax=Halovivax sp. TaxID=1935978 RepID=UPI0025BE0D60|nr:hypothetical protein [Halovivax sp.]
MTDNTGLPRRELLTTATLAAIPFVTGFGTDGSSGTVAAASAAAGVGATGYGEGGYGGTR